MDGTRHGDGPLMAESSRSIYLFSSVLNDRFREKQTFSLRLTKLGRRVTALHSIADIGVIEFGGAANDPI